MLIIINGKTLKGSISGLGSFTRLASAHLHANKSSNIDVKLIIPKRSLLNKTYDSLQDKVDLIECESALSRIPILWHLFILPLYLWKLKPDVYIETGVFFPFFLARKVFKVLVVYDLVPLEHKETFTLSRKLTIPYLFKKSVQQANFYWFISNFAQKRFVDTFPKMAVKNQFTGMSVDESRKRLNTATEVKNIVSIGTVNKRKNYSFLLKLAGHPKLQKLQFKVVGALGNDWNELKPQVALLRNVSFTGAVSDKELEKELENAQILISTSKNEGFGMPSLEAMLKGIPVVVPDHSAFRDVVKMGGERVRGWNLDEWAAVVEYVLNNYEEYKIRAQENSEIFSWSTIIKNFYLKLESSLS